MAMHRFQRTRRMRITRLLLFAVLAGSAGVGSAWGGQGTTPQPQPGAKAAPVSRSQPTSATAAKRARPSAQRGTTAVRNQAAPVPAGKRDPFKLPVIGEGKGPTENMMASAPAGVLPQGARGLIVSQLRLQGVVREQTSNKMIAVVTNETRRAYFLTEKQAVYNGIVTKITLDAVYFTENALDTDGRVTTREVVKRLSSAAGEGR